MTFKHEHNQCCKKKITLKTVRTESYCTVYVYLIYHTKYYFSTTARGIKRFYGYNKTILNIIQQ